MKILPANLTLALPGDSSATNKVQQTVSAFGACSRIVAVFVALVCLDESRAADYEPATPSHLFFDPKNGGVMNTFRNLDNRR